MKIWIMTDIEGVAGVVDFESQGYSTGKYYEDAKHLLTCEVNAAVEGALKAGAKDVLVVDGHGPGGITYEDLHPGARVFLGRPVPSDWLLDKTFSAAFLLAHHAMAGVEKGNLNHTYSSKTIANMWLNGDKIGEIGVNIMLAGCSNVPVVLVTGDSAACEEAKSYVPNIGVAVVKEGVSRTSAICLSKEASRQLIKEEAKKALERKSKIKPYKTKGPFEMVIEYISTSDAFMMSEKFGVDKVDSKTVKIKADKFLDLLNKRR